MRGGGGEPGGSRHLYIKEKFLGKEKKENDGYTGGDKNEGVVLT